MAQPAAVLSILVRANTGDAVRGIARVQTQLGATQAAGSKALGAIKTFAKGAAIGTGVGLGYAIKKAADFEQQLDSLGSVSGATGKQMEQFKRQAMAAGAATKFSALDAAAAQTELAKGGLSVRNIMKGGLRSALALAAAGEMELGEAAATTANALNLFGLEGKSSMKVADALAKAANATTADVSDFAMALRQSGGVAKTAGLSFTETVLALEALANAGTKNSDAGTSLKTALIQLIKPTKTQAELADKLNLSFLDAQGNFKSMADVSDMLRNKLGGMTAAQRTATLATLAGTDGVRTLTALYDAGPSKLDKWSAGLDKSGTAAQVAAEKQDNLKGKLENLQGSIETVAIAIGSKMLPALTDAAEKVTDIINDPKLTSAEKFNKLAGMLARAFEKGLTAAVEAAAKAGPKIAAALAKGFAKFWYGANPLTKLFAVGAVIRLFGGKGALMAAGAAVGRLLGLGVAAGTATAAVGGGAAGGMLGAMRGKLLPLAKRVGLVGLGLVLADGVISEFGKRAAAKGPDLFKALEAKQGSSSGGPFPKGLRAIPGVGAFTELSESEKAARSLVPALEAIAKSAKGIDAGKARELGRELAKIGGLSDEARGQFTALVDHALQKGEDIKAFRAGFQWIKVNGMRDMDTLRENVDRNARLISKSLEEHPAKARKALDRNFGLALDSIQTMMSKGKLSAKQGMKAIEHFARVHSQGTKNSISRNFELAKDAIFRTMVRSGKITEAGMKNIYDLTVAQLRLYGLSPKDALKGDIPKLQKLENLGPGGKPKNPPLQGNPPLLPQGQLDGFVRGGMVAAQRGAQVVPGSGSGDKVHMQAMVEPGEKVFVLNRNASSTLDQLKALNSTVPRFQQGGVIGSMTVGGPDSGLKSLVQVSLDRSREAANSVIRGAAQAAAVASAGGETSTKGLVSQVLRALAFARSHSWSGSVISGFRTRAEQAVLYARYLAGGNIAAVPGTSSHEKGQAVDVTDIPGFAAAMAIAPPNAKLMSLVPGDAPHFSVTGHQKGGLVGLQNGGGLVAQAAGKLPIPKADWELAQRIGGKFGVDPRVLVAIGLHETDWGRLGDGRNGNVLGVGSYDTGSSYQWAGLRNQLRKGASLLKGWGVHGIGDIAAGKASSWATDPGWESAVVAKFNEIKGQLPKGSAEDIRRRETDLFKRKLQKVKRPKSKLLDKIKGVGLPGGLEKKIGTLTLEADKFAEFADMASQLTADGADGQSVFGMVGGQGEPEWLFLELDRLFKLRNALIRAHELLVAYRERLSGGIEKAQKKIGTIDRQLTKKGLSTVARRKLRLERGGLVRLVRGLEGRRGKVNTARGDTLEGLEGVQGAFAPMKVMSALPDIGVLGGRIFETQLALRDLGEKPAVTDSTTGDSESAAILRELLKQSQQRFQVSQAQYPVFHQGGVVPGPVGQERMAVVQSGEGVFTPGQMQAMGTTDVHIHFAPGTEWLSDFLKVEIDRGGRRSTRGGRAPLPGRGGGI